MKPTMKVPRPGPLSASLPIAPMTLPAPASEAATAGAFGELLRRRARPACWGESERGDGRKHDRTDEWIGPMETPRIAAHAPLAASGFHPDGPTEKGHAARESAIALPELFSRFVASAAIGGDARRATLRVDLGGRRERGHVMVTAAGSEIEIEIGALDGVDPAHLESRVARRLAARGLTLVSFAVR